MKEEMPQQSEENNENNENNESVILYRWKKFIEQGFKERTVTNKMDAPHITEADVLKVLRINDSDFEIDFERGVDNLVIFAHKLVDVLPISQSSGFSGELFQYAFAYAKTVARSTGYRRGETNEVAFMKAFLDVIENHDIQDEVWRACEIGNRITSVADRILRLYPLGHDYNSIEEVKKSLPALINELKEVGKDVDMDKDEYRKVHW